jgi:hypothetical protein
VCFATRALEVLKETGGESAGPTAQPPGLALSERPCGRACKGTISPGNSSELPVGGYRIRIAFQGHTKTVNKRGMGPHTKQATFFAFDEALPYISGFGRPR